MTKLKDAIPAIYEMLAWMEENPDIESPCSIDMVFVKFDKAAAADIVKAMGTGKKRHTDDSVILTKTFGGEPDITAKLIVDRELVCKRKVVGTRIVAAVNTPERIEEIVEWECGSILKLDDPVKQLPEPAECHSELVIPF